MWDFLALVISFLPNLGARAVNLLALVAMVFVSLYIFIVRCWGDFLVRKSSIDMSNNDVGKKFMK